MESEKIIIAIDGYSSCGKSTLAKSLARVLRYIYIDSGAMYRAVTLYALRHNRIKEGKPDKAAIVESLNAVTISFEFDPGTEKNTTYLCGENVEEEIRRPDVSDQVSPVSAIREVRQAMVRFQREIGSNKGIVMDGRDIGTVVFPHAELKIFMIADPEIRAQRRHLELMQKGVPVTLEEIRENLAHRDFLDQNREESPLRKAPDAIILDNSYLTPEQQLRWALDKVESILADHEN